jgi:phosphoglycerate dehydrogenase-like enzyme
MTDAVVLHSIPTSMREEIPDHLPDDVAVRVATTPEESRELLAGAEVAVTGRFDEAWLENADELRWLQAMSAGVDYLPLDAFEDHGVALTSAAGVHAEPIGEQVLAYMTIFERRLHETMRHQRRGVWERVGGAGELAGKTVGIVGLGAIGSRVAELAQAYRMEVIGTKRDPSTAPDAVDEAADPDGLGELLDRSDYLVLACPLTEETRGLVGRQELERLDDEAVVVNVARGEVIDQDALVRALQYHSIRGAGLDVFEEEPLPADSLLWDLENVVLTPHMAGLTPHYGERLGALFAENLAAYEDGGVDALDNRRQ